MELQFRTEQPTDFTEVATLVEAAFATEPHSDHQEQYLVARLRNSPAFIPDLSIIAQVGDRIVGHILLTKAYIQNHEKRFPTLALAPVSVLPSVQGQGIGGKLIREAHRRAIDLEYTSVVLLGHADYYPRFGYVPASRYNIYFPFDAPDENCLIKALQADALEGISGQVIYAAAFFE